MYDRQNPLYLKCLKSVRILHIRNHNADVNDQPFLYCCLQEYNYGQSSNIYRERGFCRVDDAVHRDVCDHPLLGCHYSKNQENKYLYFHGDDGE